MPGTRFTDAERKDATAYILAKLATGQSIERTLKGERDPEAPRLPHISVWWLWVANDTKLCDDLARAREHGIEAHLDACIDIADNAEEDPARSRVRIDTRIKMAQMMKPKKYGAKLDLTSGGQSIPAMMEEARARAGLLPPTDKLPAPEE
jgi:GT2 family glycosyltransferase